MSRRSRQTVTVQVLHVPGCPNLAPLLQRLQEATDLPVALTEIGTAEEARDAGMNGSPTLLIDGRDPFRDPDPRDRGLSCRIYRDEDGRMVPTPSAGQIREAVAFRTGARISDSA